MANLRDVAERAGVSLATASRVASGATHVRSETRDKVEQAMRELLYVSPHRPETMGAIGILVPEFANPVFPALTEAMEKSASEAGLATIICNTSGSARRELEYVHMLLERRVGGMIFICPEINDVRGEHSHYRTLLDQGARLVLVNGDAIDLDITSVGVDERLAGRLATEHLLGLGHTRIGFAAGFPYASPTRDKRLGREDALRAAGIDPNGLVAHADFTVEGGRAALRKLLKHPKGRPTGVICSNDLMAIGVVHEAFAHGLGVPNDLSVVGFDGTDLANWVDPSLTTVAQPIPELASAAIAALAGNGAPATPRLVFRPRLRKGATTAPPAA
jgi:DNA-binding LacI/PurR family transcriptional regulator